MGVGAGLYMCDVVKKVHVRYLISWWVLVCICGAHWHQPANTTEPFVCGGDAALCKITLTTCYYCYVLDPVLSSQGRKNYAMQRKMSSWNGHYSSFTKLSWSRITLVSSHGNFKVLVCSRDVSSKSLLWSRYQLISSRSWLGHEADDFAQIFKTKTKTWFDGTPLLTAGFHFDQYRNVDSRPQSREHQRLRNYFSPGKKFPESSEFTSLLNIPKQNYDFFWTTMGLAVGLETIQPQLWSWSRVFSLPSLK